MSTATLDETTERAVLGALLLAPERIPDADAVALEDLTEARHKILLRELRALHAQGVPIDFVTLGSALRDKRLFAAAGGAEYLAELAQSTTTATHLSAHVQLLRFAARHRRTRAAASRLASAADASEREGAARELARLIEPEPPQDDGPEPLRWRPFPTHALPLELARYVAESAGAIGCDESLVALPLLAAAASAIGTTRRVALKSSWTEPSVIWAATVAESGSLKSPAVDAAFLFTQREAAVAAEANRAARRAFEPIEQAYKKALAIWHRAKAGGPAPTRPAEPKPRRVIVADATLEAVGAVLASNPRGVLLGRDELAGWFGSHGRYSGARTADASGWLELHGARPLTIDRKGAAEPLYVPRAACSIAGTIQPAILRQQATPEALTSGLLARFLLAWPPARLRAWSERTVDSATIEAAAQVFARLFRLQPFGDEPVDLPLAADARDTWTKFYAGHAERIGSADSHLAAALSKIEGAAARLALVHALCTDPDAVEVGSESVRAGCELAAWFSDEAERIYALLLDASPEDRDSSALVALIQRRGGSVTARELARASRRYSAPGAAKAALAELVKAGHGQTKWLQSGAKGGRPVELFTLTRTVDRTPEAPAASEGNVSREGRAAGFGQRLSVGAASDPDEMRPEPNADWF